MTHVTRYGGGESTYGLLGKTAHVEQVQLVSLNEKLSSYIGKVRNMRSQKSMSTENYQYFIKTLENEIVTIKQMYEAEICRLRSALEVSTREKTSISAKLKQQQVTDSAKLSGFSDSRVKSLRMELEQSSQALLIAQKETAELRAKLTTNERIKFDLESEITILTNQIRDLSSKLSAEIEIRIEAESNSATNGSFAFQENTLQQKIIDLEERLRIAQGIITSLEASVTEMSNSESTDFTLILQRLRESANRELSRYQAESQEAFNNSLFELRQKIEEEYKEKHHTTTEKKESDLKIISLTAEVADLRAQLSSAREQIKVLQMAMKSDQSSTQTKVEAAERRTREVTDMMMANMSECKRARDAQMALKTEIDAYKSLIDEEERRISTTMSTQSGVSHFEFNRPITSLPYTSHTPRMAMSMPPTTTYKSLPYVTNDNPNMKSLPQPSVPKEPSHGVTFPGIKGPSGTAPYNNNRRSKGQGWVTYA